MLFSGFLLTTSKIPVYWQYTVRYLSWIAYAFQALGNNTFTGTPNEMVIPMYVSAVAVHGWCISRTNPWPRMLGSGEIWLLFLLHILLCCL